MALADVEQLKQQNRRLVAGLVFPDEVEHETTHCLDRAKALVCGDRAADYGPPSESFECVSDAWSAYFDAIPEGRDFDGRDVANLMMIYKTIRDAHKRKPDNMDDIAGYAQVGAWIGDPDVRS